MTETTPLIRVLIVDDSAFMRKALTQLISAGRGFEVVGTAQDGREAIRLVDQLRPDVITMDVEMPEMDGIQALERIMSRDEPVPVVMISSMTTRGAEVTMRCLDHGAIDFITKPSGDNGTLDSVRYLVWQKLRYAAGAKPRKSARPRAVVPPRIQPIPRSSHLTARRVVVIGASTGGPRALLDILAELPATLPAGIVVVQHMPVQFTAAMAARFDTHCALGVQEVREGDAIRDGVVLIARGGSHLRFSPNGEARLSDEPAIWGVRPAIDPTMEDLVRVFSDQCLGIVLTGMGRDGSNGLAAISRAGGQTIAQDEATSTVFGMPRAAIEAGVARAVLPIGHIAEAILEWCHLSPSARAKTG